MFFDDCGTLEELKALYKKLCFKYHPDLNGGSVEEMQKINVEYEQFLKKLTSDWNFMNEDKTSKDWHDDKFAEVIQQIIHFEKMQIEIIGQWIWCFNSYEYHEQLKELGFWYTASKKAWVYSGNKKICYRSHNYYVHAHDSIQSLCFRIRKH